MNFNNEGRPSDSPYLESVWRGNTWADCAALCPADVRWHMMLLKHDNQVKVSVEGPITKATMVSHLEGTDWLVIKFKPGTYMPHLPVRNLVDHETILPEAAGHNFWLSGYAWQFPDFDNVETFIARLVREGILVHDRVVRDVMVDNPQALSVRSVRRHFRHATGLTCAAVRQIERARYAVSLLEQGHSILDVVYEAGYSDQPHLTRSLKHLMGQTPAEIVRMAQI